MESTGIKKSQYQVIAAERLARFERPRLALRCERNRMKNPQYYRLTKDGRFVGFKRIVTEYLQASHTRWQLTPIPHDEDETQKLWKPAMGIGTLGRERITSHGQTSEPDPEPEEQSEPIPVPSNGGLVE